MNYTGNKIQLSAKCALITAFFSAAAPVVMIAILAAPIGAQGARVGSYNTLKRKVETEMAQMESENAGIEHMIALKRAAQDPNVKAQLLTQMLHAHKRLRRMYQVYSKDLDRLRYEYPSRGRDRKHSQLPRKYSNFRLRSLEDMEKGSGLDQSLDETKQQLIETYGLREKHRKHVVEPARPRHKDEKDRPKLVE